MTGVDIPVPECQLVIHQPRIKEISLFGEDDFNLGAHLICISKDNYPELKQIEELSNFNLLMKILEGKEKAADKKQMVKQILLLLLPNCNRIIITPRSIMCNKDSENLIIDEGNFDAFQTILRKVLCFEQKPNKDGDEIHEVYNPANDKAREIAEKIYQGRKKVAEQKTSKNPNDSALVRKFSIIAVGLRYSPEEINNFTLFQLNNLSDRLAMKIAQDMDTKIRLAGGKPDEAPEPWTGPL